MDPASAPIVVEAKFSPGFVPWNDCDDIFWRLSLSWRGEGRALPGADTAAAIDSPPVPAAAAARRVNSPEVPADDDSGPSIDVIPFVEVVAPDVVVETGNVRDGWRPALANWPMPLLMTVLVEWLSRKVRRLFS